MELFIKSGEIDEYILTFTRSEAVEFAINLLNPKDTGIPSFHCKLGEKHIRVLGGVERITDINKKAVEFLATHLDKFDSDAREQVILSLAAGNEENIFYWYRTCFNYLERIKLKELNDDNQEEFYEWCKKWRY